MLLNLQDIAELAFWDQHLAQVSFATMPFQIILWQFIQKRLVSFDAFDHHSYVVQQASG